MGETYRQKESIGHMESYANLWVGIVESSKAPAWGVE